MSDQTPDQNLHLPSLVIKNFRGIDELTIPRLGRVTLLAGKNGVGKTTVLDAVRVWAARGRRHALSSVLRERGDSFLEIAETDDRRLILRPDWDSLFTNRLRVEDPAISIGSSNGVGTLLLWSDRSHTDTSDPLPLAPATIEDGFRLLASFDDTRQYSVLARHAFGSAPHELVCNALGPNPPTNPTVENYWSAIALTAHETRALDALNLATNVAAERVALIDTVARSELDYQLRFMVKVADKDYPVPLRTLGDGAMRCFAVALALANSTDGFLLIDEAENGIHHSIQAKFWNMVLQTAERNNVQVIATTHSWDCVVGFAQAANELEDVVGVLYRIQRNGDRLRAVEYPESDLANAAKHRIEVR